MRARRRVALAIAAIAAFGAIPAAANGQALSVYPEDIGSRTFGTDVGGWTQSSATAGPCLAVPLLCPSTTNTFEPADGADGATDGYIDTEFSAVAGALGATSSGIWTSPKFTYNGAGGQVPQLLGLVLHRRADVGQLLGLGHTATYSVEVIDVADDTKSFTVIDAESLAGAAAWEQITPVPIAPASLTIGREYQIRIISTFATGLATVLINGSADYDNVGIAAIVGGPGGGGGGGGGGGYVPLPPSDGAGPGNSGVFGPAQLKGSKLIVRVRCNRNVETKCGIRLSALLKKSGPKVTKGKRTSVAAGREKRVALKVKSRYVSELETREKIWIKQRVAANGKTRKIVKRVPLRLG